MRELREQCSDLLRGEPVPTVATLEPCQLAIVLVNVDPVKALECAVERVGAREVNVGRASRPGT
jgi:hypothetical protein